MSRWTNDRWVSTPHRVIVPLNKNKDGSYPARQSIKVLLFLLKLIQI